MEIIYEHNVRQKSITKVRFLYTKKNWIHASKHDFNKKKKSKHIFNYHITISTLNIH